MKDEITIVIPTFNEAEGILDLLQEITDTVNLPHQIIVVDDSTDNTPKKVLNFSLQHNNVILIHRPQPERTGLATAVIRGINASFTKYVVVMDGDGQHPPSAINDLYQTITRTNSDMVVATRYRSGGQSDGLDGFSRHFISRSLALLPRLLFPHLLKLSDPLSGLFIVRKDALSLDQCHPRGWKIGLEILVFCNIKTCAESPYSFRPRSAGESKANFKTGIDYFRHLGEMFFRRYLRPTRR